MASKKYTREQLIDLMKDYYNKFGYPNTREFNNNKNYPTLYTYRNIFGSIPNALKECDIEIPKEKIWLYEREEYSKEELLKQFKYQLDKHLKETGKLLIDDDIDAIKDMPSAGCYYKQFGTLDNLYKVIGIDRTALNNDKLENDMKKKYTEIRDIIGRTPHSRDLQKFSRENENYYYACTTYLHHFKSIRNLNELMGDKPRNWTRDLSDEEMLETLRKLSKDLGIVPNQKEVELCEYCGSIVSYTKRFGSFVEAIIKAGMIPRGKKEPLITPKGNKALSGYEYKFMLILEQYDIAFKKEEFYKKYIKELNKNYRFDFTLDFNSELFFIEIFGITGDEKYDNKTKEKIQMCKDNKLNLIEFYPDDIGRNSFEEIYKLLMDRIKQIKQLRKDLI